MGEKSSKISEMPFADEGIVALLLDLDEVGNIDDFVDLPELAPLRLPVLLNG